MPTLNKIWHVIVTTQTNGGGGSYLKFYMNFYYVNILCYLTKINCLKFRRKIIQFGYDPILLSKCSFPPKFFTYFRASQNTSSQIYKRNYCSLAMCNVSWRKLDLFTCFKHKCYSLNTYSTPSAYSNNKIQKPQIFHTAEITGYMVFNWPMKRVWRHI